MSVIEAEALFFARSQYAPPVRPSRETENVRVIHIKALLDALPHPTALFDTGSRQLYTNQRLKKQLQHEPQPQVVLNGMRELGRGVAVTRAERAETIGTVAGTYRARAQYLQMQLIGSGDTVLISIEPAAPELPGVDNIRLHFALTEQEARIALLLAERATTAEIASQLDITKNTVRRHIERVLAKLRIGTRSSVRDQLMLAR